jgi:hypothetical protein
MKRFFRHFCFVAALAALSVVATAQMKITVAELVTFIQSSIKLKHDDVKVAEYVKRMKLSDKLDARTVENLQGMGAGPRTVLALKALMTETSALPAAAPPPPKPVYVGPPPPNSIEQKEILAQITDAALNYSANLPNFICLQVTRRYAAQASNENFTLQDVIAERLSYYEQMEDYKVVSRNGVPVTGMKHEQMGGASSSGEFGSMLKEIFSPESNTRFEWERWATLRGKRMYVYSFRVPQETSKYTIYAEEVKRRIVVGYHGLVYAQANLKTNGDGDKPYMVMRLTMTADNIPADFPVQEMDLDLNYDYTSISGTPYLLPLKSELHSKDGRYLVRNETEFRLYNKFGTESEIQFDTSTDVPAPLPENRTKEDPPPAK